MKAKKIVALVLALVMVLALGTSALAATGDMSNPVTVSGVTLRFGDPNYPATAPEKYMYFKETGTGTYDAIYSTDGTTEDASYYPDILAFYVVPEEVNGEPVTTITSITGTGIDFVTYDASGNATISSTVAVNDDGFYTIKPKSDNSSITVNGNVTVNFSAPNVQIAEGSKPAAVTGYLPVGQFARYNSFGWGNLYTDNTNIKSTSNTTKFLDGYVSTGVSLGMAGGYIQFDMGTRPIMNDANNPYGIDFIVYGNAFVGNPEAAGVMVSNDGVKWYTLAGSRHYMSDTKWNQKISYARIEGKTQRALDSAFTADGVYYSTDYVSPSTQTQTAINAAISAATWQGTIPYFLGAINEEALALENERAVLKRRLTIERRRLEENRHLMGGGFERAVKLIGEARQVGLIDSSTQVDYQNYQEVFSLLQDTLNWSPQMVSSGSGMDRLTFLQSKLQEARNEYDEIGVSLDNARKFVGEASGYSSEAQHQKVRLESIGLFEHIDFDPGKCPLCSGTLENPLPSVEMIRTSIVNLDKSIANVTREQPKLRAFISTLEQERQKKQEEIRALEAEIDGIYQQEDERARLRDINARKGKVIGRISLWVESVQNDTESEQQEQVIREIEKRVQEIDSILDTDSVDERKQSALSRIQEDMTKWAKELQLEHCDNPYRLDLNKVTVIVDKPERPVPLKQLGSGSNWVGVHLIAYFALQHYFIGAKRPVPRFMFLDQPSQVYFPSEFDEKKTDWNEVNKIYQFVIDRTTELQGQLQVIIVDHADLKKDSFREFIRENWWPDDKNLVPIDWYKSE